MRGAGWAEGCRRIASGLALCAVLAGTARGESTAGEAPSASGMPRAAELAVLRYKLLALEQRRFDQRFPLTGMAAGEAVEALRAAGYTCGIDPAEPTKPSGVSCARGSEMPGDLCRERRVRLSVDWQDARTPAARLEAQLAASRVTDRAFQCD